MNFNPFDLLKNTQAIKEQTEKLKEELASIRVEGSSGGKMVVVTMTGKKEIKSIKLDKTAVDPDDVEMLEDLILAAIKDATAKAEELSSEKMGPMGGLGGLM